MRTAGEKEGKSVDRGLFATTIFCHRHKPQIVGLFEALLQRQDITPEDLAKIAELVERKK